MESLRTLIPAQSTSWWIVRPQRIFSHRRLGAALSRSIDHLAEQALVARAERVGYDLRTVDRALWAQTPRGTLAVALGTFDAARIVSRLWERLLPPRRRVDGLRGVARVEGRLANDEVTAAVDAACGVAAWSERDPTLVDRALAAPVSAPPSPDDALVIGHLARSPELAREALGPFAARTSVIELRASLHGERGVGVDVTLLGALGAADRVALRDRVRRIAESPLLRALGADVWTAGERVSITPAAGGLRMQVEVPWAAFEALSEVLRGRVARGADDAQGF